MLITVLNGKSKKEYNSDSWHFDHNTQQVLVKVKNTPNIKKLEWNEWTEIYIRKSGDA